MDRKNKGFSARKPNSGSVQSFHPNKSKLVSNNSSFHAPKSAKGRAEDIFSEKKRFNESSDTLKYKNNKKKNNKSQIFSEKSFDESSSSLMSFREEDQDPPMKFRSVKNNKEETGKILPQSKKIKKQIPKTPSTEDDLPQDVSPKKKKTQWTSNADAQVIRLLAELGPKWTEIGKIMGGRSGKQVRDRYLQKLRPDISFEKWTQEEDDLVIALYKKYGHKWSQIASEVKTRSESQIKNRFNTRLKRLINNKKPQKNGHRQMEEEADQEQEEVEEQEEEEEQQDDEEEEENLGGALSPLVRAESLAKLEDDKHPHHNVALVDFEEIFLKKSMRLPSFQKLTSVSIKKQNSAIAQEFRSQGMNYSSLFNSGSQPHHILPDFHHHRSKHDF